ncbi:MAG TPA: DEAD/DEAH box helicase family protein [Ktedonobacteraceae bacterium]|nr:DEAD/DEAH box helicase family protein [Ktedonobacteraceae bacterium]
MLKFVRSVPNTYAAQMVERWLGECFGNDDGVCYYKHPAVMTRTGKIPDFIVFTRTNQPLVIKIIDQHLQDISLVEDDEWIVNSETIDSPLLELEDLVLKLESKFLDQRKLRNRLDVQGVLAFPFIMKEDFEETFGTIQENVSTLWSGGNTQELEHTLGQELSSEEWILTRSVIQGATNLHKPSNIPSPNITTLGAAIKELDKQIASLDDEQERVALEIAPGPQRIRGLAGTGKTVLLAMKAANIHILNPDKKILFTFHTNSLYNQVRELISKTYREHTGTDPDWDLLHVRHGWGSRSRPGIYSDLCARQGVIPLDLRSASAIDRAKNPFQICCEHALQRQISPEYDFILIDEAQDFPGEFFRVLSQLSIPFQLSDEIYRRIYWAYDELQSLASLEIPKPEDLFGYDAHGIPLVSLDGPDYPGSIEKDFVLHRSYRCPQDVLMLAHAIGLGIHNPKGPVQMLEDQGYWEAVGYKIERGKLQKGEQVVIFRPSENSPNRIHEIYSKQKLVVVKVFQDRVSELNWIAESIVNDVKVEKVAPRQIIVISLDQSKTKDHLLELQRRLVEANIASTMPGLIDDSSAFAEVGKVTLSNVFRAKGNEAHIVYILGFDALYDYVEGIGNRNHAFASITRSKAWLRISGTGRKMEAAKKEVDQILEAIPRFKFKFPDMKTIRRLDAETSYKRKKLKAASEAVNTLQKTEVEALEKLASTNPEVFNELVKRLNEVARENQ